MVYRRNKSMWPRRTFDSSNKVKVTIAWDMLTNATYSVKFDNIGKNFQLVQLVVDIIKQTIPNSQRVYDADLKIWFIGEAYGKNIADACAAIPQFECSYTEKPASIAVASVNTAAKDYEEFKRMLSFAHLTIEGTKVPSFKEARKLYLRACSKLHPDINPHMAQEMATLNTVWVRLSEGELLRDGRRDTPFFKKEEVNA